MSEANAIQAAKSNHIAVRNEAASNDGALARRIAGAVALVMGALVAGLCWFAAGANLGLFLGTLLLLPLVAPALLTPFRWQAMMGLWLGVGCVWFASTASSSVYAADVIRCFLVVGAMLLAIAGLTRLLCWLGIAPVVAAAAVAIFSLFWLTWPVWMVDALESAHAETIVSLLSPISPGFAVNGAMPNFGAWDHYPHLAYTTLTVLNQDVAYRMPHSVVPAVVLHAMLGLLLLLPDRTRRTIT